MKLEDLRRSENVEDRRGMRVGRTGAGIGIGTLLLLVVGYFLGINPSTLMGVAEVTQSMGSSAAPSGAAASGAPADQAGGDVAKVLGTTEDVWSQIFRELGAKQAYPAPTLVLFSEAVESACGMASSASGPFYCPGDGKLYLDTTFYDQLDREFGAAGDFAQAYVIAHEVGHHIQTLIGTTEKVQEARRRSTEAVGNLTQVKMELQADCYAGIWASRIKKVLEPGDIEEALNAAAAVGDDTIQKRVQGRVVPDSFTHGSAKQRASWFGRGFQGSNLQSCDTFAAGAVT
jgi:predicted metalloprotease